MNLFEVFDAFPEVAKPIIIKSDMLRLGVKFSEVARRDANARTDITFKGFDNFAYSRSATALYTDKIPSVFYLDDGTPEGTIIQIRPASDTPYLLDIVDGGLTLLWSSQQIGTGHYMPKPNFYEQAIDGVPMVAYAYALGGDLLDSVVLKYCEHFSRGQECLFCDLVPFTTMQKKEGEAITQKAPEKVAEVFNVAFLSEPRFRHFLISGGSFVGERDGKRECDWYGDYLKAVRRRMGYLSEGCLQISAQDDEGWRRLADAGVPSVQSNIEVWDKRLFEILCPGKTAVWGYDEWVKRVIRSVKFFPPGHVNPSFVLGIEMAQPFGFKSVDQAVKSTLSGYDLLMSEGVLPRQGSHWAIEPDSRLAGQQPPPLEYYIEIGRGFLELWQKHGFPHPAASWCRYCCLHGTEYDWEYWHGNNSYRPCG